MLKAKNQDIAVVEVQLLDSNNNRAVLASNRIDLKLAASKIIGVDNGDTSCLDNYKLPKRDARFGRCIVIIQTTGKTGNIILEAKVAGITGSVCESDQRVIHLRVGLKHNAIAVNYKIVFPYREKSIISVIILN